MLIQTPLCSRALILINADSLPRAITTGVWNVTHEGLHCGERKYRRYAYGVNDRWQPLVDSPWKPLRGKGAYSYRLVFYEKFICDPTRLNQSAGQILDRFRENWHEQM